MVAMDHAVWEQRVTTAFIRDKKGKQRITFVTAYDFPTAKLADEAGFDMVLIGDTLAEVVLGYETTLPAEESRRPSLWRTCLTAPITPARKMLCVLRCGSLKKVERKQ